CRNCGKSVSPSAATCPRCGEPDPGVPPRQPAGPVSYLLGAGLSAWFAYNGVLLIQGDPESCALAHQVTTACPAVGFGLAVLLASGAAGVWCLWCLWRSL